MDVKIGNDVCRICLYNKSLISFYSSENWEEILNKLVKCASVKVDKDDGLPQSICEKCFSALQVAFLFRSKCEQTDATLRNLIHKQKDILSKNNTNDFVQYTSIQISVTPSDNPFFQDLYCSTVYNSDLEEQVYVHDPKIITKCESTEAKNVQNFDPNAFQNQFANSLKSLNSDKKNDAEKNSSREDDEISLKYDEKFLTGEETSCNSNNQSGQNAQNTPNEDAYDREYLSEEYLSEEYTNESQEQQVYEQYIDENGHIVQQPFRTITSKIANTQKNDYSNDYVEKPQNVSYVNDNNYNIETINKHTKSNGTGASGRFVVIKSVLKTNGKHYVMLEKFKNDQSNNSYEQSYSTTNNSYEFANDASNQSFVERSRETSVSSTYSPTPHPAHQILAPERTCTPVAVEPIYKNHILPSPVITENKNKYDDIYNDTNNVFKKLDRRFKKSSKEPTGVSYLKSGNRTTNRIIKAKRNKKIKYPTINQMTNNLIFTKPKFAPKQLQFGTAQIANYQLSRVVTQKYPIIRRSRVERILVKNPEDLENKPDNDLELSKNELNNEIDNITSGKKSSKSTLRNGTIRNTRQNVETLKKMAQHTTISDDLEIIKNAELQNSDSNNKDRKQESQPTEEKTGRHTAIKSKKPRKRNCNEKFQFEVKLVPRASSRQRLPKKVFPEIDLYEYKPEKFVPNQNIKTESIHLSDSSYQDSDKEEDEPEKNVESQKIKPKFKIKCKFEGKRKLKMSKSIKEESENEETKMLLSHLSCDVCGKTFPYKSHLIRHVRIHTGIKPFTCDCCQKNFSSLASLTTHVRNTEGDFSYRCSECGRGFVQQSVLKRHMHSHTGERQYQCNICDKSFAYDSSYRLHLRMHKIKEPQHKCEICDKQFRYTSTLNAHLKEHSGIKPFTCGVCRKSFFRKTLLTRHMRSHTKERPYKCKICKAKFAYSGGLASHRKLHTGYRPFKCTLCDYTFFRNAHLQNHMATIHNNGILFECAKCELKFDSKLLFKKHTNWHEGKIEVEVY